MPKALHHTFHALKMYRQVVEEHDDYSPETKASVYQSINRAEAEVAEVERFLDNPHADPASRAESREGRLAAIMEVYKHLRKYEEDERDAGVVSRTYGWLWELNPRLMANTLAGGTLLCEVLRSADHDTSSAPSLPYSVALALLRGQE